MGRLTHVFTVEALESAQGLIALGDICVAGVDVAQAALGGCNKAEDLKELLPSIDTAVLALQDKAAGKVWKDPAPKLRKKMMDGSAALSAGKWDAAVDLFLAAAKLTEECEADANLGKW